MPHGLVAYGETTEGKYYVTVVTLEKGESKTRADALIGKYGKMGFEAIYSDVKNGKSITVLAPPENKIPDAAEIINMVVIARTQNFAPKRKVEYRDVSLEEIAEECLNFPWILHS